MSELRFKAIDRLSTRKPINVEQPSLRVSDYYGESVFGLRSMREYISGDVFKEVKASIETGSKLDRKYADQVASSMKAWAMESGATHYTHWFQPLTGATAEKHDAFFDPLPGGGAIEKFDGDLLTQQEPDASSFPHGGIRNTFEARGYTAWDPASPAFIIDKTLCIPTIFVSYTGEALDHKAPLIRSLHALDKAATSVCQYFDKNVKRVSATLGWEQEYFLVDAALYNARPDLMLTGRTLFGHSSAKDQQLDDHYFGSIPGRVGSFMRDYEIESLKLGIPVKTRHNEVGPGQYECAPVFEEANLAVDHNQLLMDVMEKIARRHDFRILFHEKPFAGINGSGKHNNWSLATDGGTNLLGPGKTPKKNLQFLTFFINTIKAVSAYPDLLRASIASASNDHRLGANEAPPAIISVFIGSQLTKVLDDLEHSVKKGKTMSPDEKTDLKLNIIKIPEILLDNTDRNRTSPFAFTGNKFEFRAVGSTANCASPMMVLNTIVAQQLNEFKTSVDALIKKGTKKDEAIFQVLRSYIVASKDIRFEGNGYGQEWVEEAEKRGLSNIKNTPEALASVVSDSTIDLMAKHDVLTKRELEARYEIDLEGYTKKIQIESRVMGDLAINHIIPTAIQYQSMLVNNVRGLKDILEGKDYKNASAQQIDRIKEISDRIRKIRENVESMVEARKKANAMESEKAKALAYNKEILPFFEPIRYDVDKLELMVSDELWPLPKYREMLFGH